MIDEAKKYEEEDNKMKLRIESKNSLENYCYSIKTTLDDDANKQKISEEELRELSSKVDETLQWIESGSLESESEEIDAKKKELESFAGPIMTKIVSGASDAGQTTTTEDSPEQSTPVEEID